MLKTAAKAGYGLAIFLTALFVTMFYLNKAVKAIPLAAAEASPVINLSYGSVSLGLQPASGQLNLNNFSGELKIYDPSEEVVEKQKKEIEKKQKKPAPKKVVQAAQPKFSGNKLPAYTFGEPVWDKLARCESGGRPDAVSANGLYHGMFQFSAATWRAVGGTGLPSQASPNEQLQRAKELRKRSGWGQWPHCSKTLNLR